jgi:hypothetical protein
MLIPSWVEELWQAEHSLTVDAVQALHDQADAGDVHPIITGIELLREHEASRLGVGDAFVGVAGQE